MILKEKPLENVEEKENMLLTSILSFSKKQESLI